MWSPDDEGASFQGYTPSTPEQEERDRKEREQRIALYNERAEHLNALGQWIHTGTSYIPFEVPLFGEVLGEEALSERDNWNIAYKEMERNRDITITFHLGQAGVIACKIKKGPRVYRFLDDSNSEPWMYHEEFTDRVLLRYGTNVAEGERSSMCNRVYVLQHTASKAMLQFRSDQCYHMVFK